MEIMNELSTERAIEALYTVRAYYASLTAGYPKGKDRRGIGDVMCSEIANSCLMAIKALEQARWIPVSEKLPPRDENVLAYHRNESFDYQYVSWIDDYSEKWAGFIGNLSDKVLAWMPLPEPYRESEANTDDS